MGRLRGVWPCGMGSGLLLLRAGVGGYCRGLASPGQLTRGSSSDLPNLSYAEWLNDSIWAFCFASFYIFSLFCIFFASESFALLHNGGLSQEIVWQFFHTPSIFFEIDFWFSFQRIKKNININIKNEK